MTAPVRKKSPRAPSIDLADAIARAQAIYERERRHSVPADIAAQALGYKSANNGTALSVLASLRYYGLLERSAGGLVAVTKGVEDFKFSPSEEQKGQLVVAWLRNPPLFAELLDKYPDGLPSDATIRFELIQRGFNPAAAEATLAVFRRSVDYVNYFDRSKEVPTTELHEDEIASNLDRSRAPDAAQTPAAPEPAIHIEEQTIPATPPTFGLDRIPVRLSGGRRAWLEIPSPFYAADKRRLKAQIDLLLADDEESDEG